MRIALPWRVRDPNRREIHDHAAQAHGPRHGLVLQPLHRRSLLVAILDARVRATPAPGRRDHTAGIIRADVRYEHAAGLAPGPGHGHRSPAGVRVRRITGPRPGQRDALSHRRRHGRVLQGMQDRRRLRMRNRHADPPVCLWQQELYRHLAAMSGLLHRHQWPAPAAVCPAPVHADVTALTNHTAVDVAVIRVDADRDAPVSPARRRSRRDKEYPCETSCGSRAS